MATTNPDALSPDSTPGAAPADTYTSTPGAAPAAYIDPTHVAHTFCYVRGNQPETTLQLLHNGQVSYASNEPHGTWSYEWRAQGIDGWSALYGKGVYTICFQGNPTSNKPPREHVFTQVDDTNAYRLIDHNPAWSVVLIEKQKGG